ncbi:MAG: ABC transporter permease [SAR202 cluster bacterium]|jgi:peptide/nickel transport system permease protein|nr:ABC transporter permease [SAR202 cluster bacterium]
MASSATTSQQGSRFGQAIVNGVAASGRMLRNELALALRTTAGKIGLPLVIFHLILATVGPLLAPYLATDFQRDEDNRVLQLQSPNTTYWLGTDNAGRDVLSRVMSGASSIIAVSVAGAGLGIFLGTVVGMSSGYKGGRTDEIVMRVMDGLMSFPSLLLALLVLSTLGANHENIIATIGVVFMPRVARVLRSVTLSLKTLEFVQSARLRGEPALYIIFREILPNAIPVLAVEASVRLSYAILLASSLGFLGLGVQPPSPDWGLMISESRNFLVDAPWIGLAPAAGVASLVVGVNLLTDGLRQARGLPVGGDHD